MNLAEFAKCGFGSVRIHDHANCGPSRILDGKTYTECTGSVV